MQVVPTFELVVGNAVKLAAAQGGWQVRNRREYLLNKDKIFPTNIRVRLSYTRNTRLSATRYRYKYEILAFILKELLISENSGSEWRIGFMGSLVPFNHGENHPKKLSSLLTCTGACGKGLGP